MEKSECLFLVSSAIYTQWGVYSKEERLQQTIETCKSIKERAPADVIVLDGGEQVLTKEDQELLSPHVEAIFSFSDHETVKRIHQVQNWDIVKNMNEILMFGITFEYTLKEQIPAMEKYKRIFKMSGRYKLNDEFNYDTHYNATDKIVIRGPYSSQFPPHVTGGTTEQYMSRLWSFDAKLLPYISGVYKTMFADMSDRVAANGYIDIEHLLFKHLNPDLIQRIEKIGVEGNIAPNGQGVSD